MIFLLLCIVFTVGLFIIFKYFARFGVNTFQAIVINYWICVVTGLLFIDNPGEIFSISFSMGWVRAAAVLGLLFIFTFNLMAFGTQTIGVAIATVASKMSLVLPVFASIFVFGTSAKGLTWYNAAGMIAALVAIVLTSATKSKGKLAEEVVQKPVKLNLKVIVLPLGIFLFSGFIEILINYTNYSLLPQEYSGLFPVVSFGMAAVAGTVILLARLGMGKEKLEMKSLVGGIVLGVPNYFSIYLLVRALTSFNNDGAFLFPVLNIGIIILSAIAAVLLFREKLSAMNKLGIGLAVLAILLLSFKEISLFAGA